MLINAISHYAPNQAFNNEYFIERNDLSEEWILNRTGIQDRRKAAFQENTDTMAIEAVNLSVNKIPYSISDIDLIIVTYTLYNTVETLAHSIQNEFSISDVNTISISTACSSFINTLEFVEEYFY